MLSPGIRLVERPGVLHFVDGRRVVSLRTDDATCAAIRAVLAAPDSASDDADVDGDGDGDTVVRDDVRNMLADLGLLRPAGSVVEGGTLAFAGAAAGVTLDPTVTAARLRDVTVHVLGDTDGLLRRELGDCGLRCVSGDTGADEITTADLDPRHDLVVAVADPARPATSLRAVNAACIEAGVTWLPVSAYDGAVVRIGPLIVPGDTACLECTERRLAANAEYTLLYRDVVADAPAAPAPAAVTRWAASMAALSLLAWVAAADARVPGRLLTLTPADLSVRAATVYRVPRCRACAGPDHLHAAAPWAVARDH